MYKITLADGTVLNNIEVNSTTMISRTPLDPSMFEHNLSPVDIELIGERSPLDQMFLEGHHDNMVYFPIVSPVEGEYWFALHDVPEDQLRYEQIRSDIEYLAMMTDTEL